MYSSFIKVSCDDPCKMIELMTHTVPELIRNTFGPEHLLSGKTQTPKTFSAHIYSVIDTPDESMISSDVDGVTINITKLAKAGPTLDIKTTVEQIIHEEKPDERNLRSCDELGHKIST